MSFWSALTIISVALSLVVAIPHGISSHANVMKLWNYLREHHFLTWIALGGPDAVSEFSTRRSFGSFRKIYSALESIEDPELRSLVENLKRHERFAERVLMPIFLVGVLGFTVHSPTS